jgi:hypothetical protein
VIFPKATSSREAKTLEHRDRSVVKEGACDRPTLNIFRIAFYRASSETRDFLQRALERNGRNPFTAIFLVDEETGDPPIRKGSEAFEIGALELNAWQLVRRPELTPTYTGCAVKYESGVSSAFPDSTLFLRSVLRRGLGTPYTLRMEGHAPAAAPYAIVPLDQPREIWPGAFIKGFHDEIGH